MPLPEASNFLVIVGRCFFPGKVTTGMYLAVCYGVVLAQKPTEVRNRSERAKEGDTGGWSPEYLEGLLQPSQNLHFGP